LQISYLASVAAARVNNNEELNNMYCSPSIIGMIKPRTMRLAVHVARMGRRGMDIGGKARRKETTDKI
jgi:hypothetical protein